jgi:RimJ/RimL family protein N-acetyltransferase
MASEQKLRLRPLEREDLHWFVEWFADPEVLEFLGLHNPLSQAREEKWFDKVWKARKMSIHLPSRYTKMDIGG